MRKVAIQPTKQTAKTPASSRNSKKVDTQPTKHNTKTPASSFQKTTPGKNKMIPTSEPVLPYFGISNDPDFIKA